MQRLAVLVALAMLCSSVPMAISPRAIGEVGIVEVQAETLDPAAFSNVTVHDGILIVGDDSTLVIENCLYNITGTLIVRGAGRVVIRHAVFVSNVEDSAQADMGQERLWRTRHIIVEDDGRLEASDCDLIFHDRIPFGYPEAHGFLLFDRAVVTLKRASFIHEGSPGEFLYLYNNSRLEMENVVLSTFNPGDRYYTANSGVWSWDEATLQIQSSVIDEIIFEGNCAAWLTALETEYIQTSNQDVSEIKAFDSTMDELVTWPSSQSRIWLDNCTVGDLLIRSGSTAWLHDSLEANDSLPSSGAVFVVWDIPLMGQLAFPYGWAPYVLPAIAVLVVVAAVATVTLVLFSRRKRRRFRRTRRLAKAQVT